MDEANADTKLIIHEGNEGFDQAQIAQASIDEAVIGQ